MDKTFWPSEPSGPQSFSFKAPFARAGHPWQPLTDFELTVSDMFDSFRAEGYTVFIMCADAQKGVPEYRGTKGEDPWVLYDGIHRPQDNCWVLAMLDLTRPLSDQWTHPAGMENAKILRTKPVITVPARTGLKPAKTKYGNAAPAWFRGLVTR